VNTYNCRKIEDCGVGYLLKEGSMKPSLMKNNYALVVAAIFILGLGGCSQGGPGIKSPSLSSQAFLGSYQVSVNLNPPLVTIEQVKSSGLSPEALAGTDLIASAFPFRIRGAMSFVPSTATISVTMTNTSSTQNVSNVDVRIRSITDINITIQGDTPCCSVPGGIVTGGYFFLGTVNSGNGVTNDTWIFNNVTGDYRFNFDVYGDLPGFVECNLYDERSFGKVCAHCGLDRQRDDHLGRRQQYRGQV
jgi:hypothetical protein